MTVLGLLATIVSPIHARRNSRRSEQKTSRRKEQDRKAGKAAAFLGLAGTGILIAGLAGS